MISSAFFFKNFTDLSNWIICRYAKFAHDLLQMFQKCFQQFFPYLIVVWKLLFILYLKFAQNFFNNSSDVCKWLNFSLNFTTFFFENFANFQIFLLNSINCARNSPTSCCRFSENFLNNFFPYFSILTWKLYLYFTWKLPRISLKFLGRFVAILSKFHLILPLNSDFP